MPQAQSSPTPKPPVGFFASRFHSVRYALSGIARLLHDEKNARVHAVATLLVFALGLWLRLSRLEWAVIALTVFVVWGAEAANTAIERLCDVVTERHHPGIGASKDLAAAAVLLVCIGALVVGLLILGPHVLSHVR